MTKKSHNKKRNVGILYELLLNTAAKGMVESNVKLTKSSYDIETLHTVLKQKR